jgi:cytochrome c553
MGRGRASLLTDCVACHAQLADRRRGDGRDGREVPQQPGRELVTDLREAKAVLVVFSRLHNPVDSQLNRSSPM